MRALKLPTKAPDILGELAGKRGKTSLSLPNDNMGGDSDTGSGAKCVESHALRGYKKLYQENGGEPQEEPRGYFHRLAIDTVQFAVEASVLDEEVSSLLWRGRKAAEKLQQRGAEGTLKVAAHDGTALQVYPHGGRGGYGVLMRGTGGLEIRACPSEKMSNMPQILVLFGAEWCLKKSYADLVEWTKGLAEYFGYEMEALKLSRLEVRCDVPERFVELDRKRMRGTGTRNAKVTAHFHGDDFCGLNNQGGKKPFKFSIYDKRRQVREERKQIWQTVWNSYGIEEDTPIWRVEAKWNRDGLKERGIDQAEDLTYRSLTGLWSWFTRQYLILVSDPSKRTDRTKPTRRWSRVQDVTEVMEPMPPIERAPARPDDLIKQAEGCIASALANSGAARDHETTMRVLRSAMNGAVSRLQKQRLVGDMQYVPQGAG